ncbi:hypothetical protein Tco_0933546 [Tanacetum coccineum]
MVAYLEKSEGSEGFYQIINFLSASHIQYALIENPTIYVSFIKQFWRTATARIRANGEVELTATIDGQVKTITEASLRRHLKLEDNGGVTNLLNSEIFEQLAIMDADAKIKEKNSANTKIILEEEQPTELVEDIGSGEKGASEVSTANIAVTTAEVSTAAKNLVYIRRSTKKRKDKGKGIMTELEPEKKTKLQQRQERGSLKAAIRLEEQFNEEESHRIARDAEIARQLHEEINKAGQERVVAKDDQAHDIYWSDPSVIRYHALQNRPRSISEHLCNFGKIIIVGNNKWLYRGFEYMLRILYRKDLFKLWSLVQERFNASELTEDKEKELWVEMKTLFDLDEKDLLELQRYMHDPLKWWLYDTCVVHHALQRNGHDRFMLFEKDYPSEQRDLPTLSYDNKLRVDHYSDMVDVLLQKIYIIANMSR